MTKATQTLVRLVLSGEEHRLDKEILSKYEWLDEYYFLDERTRVRLHEKEGYVDTDGNEIGPIKYEEPDIFNEGFAGVCVDDKWGFINKQGEEAIRGEFLQGALCYTLPQKGEPLPESFPPRSWHFPSFPAENTCKNTNCHKSKEDLCGKL